jgi:hypothetical protein
MLGIVEGVLENIGDLVRASTELFIGIARRFYVWVVPLLLLQPFALARRLGIGVQVPEAAYWILLSFGLAISAADTFRISQARIRKLEEESAARRVVGSLRVEPFAGADVDRATPNAAVVQLAGRVSNTSPQAITYRICGMTATISGRATNPMTGTTKLTLDAGGHMDYYMDRVHQLPVRTAIPVQLVIEYEYGLPLAESVAREIKTFVFDMKVVADGQVDPFVWNVEQEGPLLITDGRGRPATISD